jgi:hypothetical protein
MLLSINMSAKVTRSRLMNLVSEYGIPSHTKVIKEEPRMKRGIARI